MLWTNYQIIRDSESLQWVWDLGIFINFDRYMIIIIFFRHFVFKYLSYEEFF